MELKKEQIKVILQNAPMGSNPRNILEQLVERGYTLEGVDPVVTNSYREQKRAVKEAAGNRFEEKPQGFWEKARQFATGVIGGGKVAEGLGKAIAGEKIQGKLSQAELSASDTELALQRRIFEKQERGEDTSRLEGALQGLKANQLGLRDVQEDFVDSLPSNKEVIGSAVRLGATALAPTVAGKASQAFGVGKATTFTSGALRGAGAGATAGAIEGVVQGAGIAAEQDRPTEDLIKAGLLGGAGGAVTGGVLGGVIGGVSGKLRGKKLARQDFSKTLATPKETAKTRAQALQEGRLEDPTLFKKAELSFSKRDRELADAIDDVVKPEATLGENIDSIRKKVGDINAGVTDYITKNKVPLNRNQLRSKLLTGKEDLNLIFASDASAEKTYDAVVDAFMNEVKTGDTLGVFKARQSLDKIPAIKKLLDSDVLGENARREIVKAVRSSANDYVSTLLPVGNTFKESLLQEHLMLEALSNIAEKGQAIVGKNKLQLLVKEYPFINSIIGAGALALGLKAIGVGGAVTASTD